MNIKWVCFLELNAANIALSLYQMFNGFINAPYPSNGLLPRDTSCTWFKSTKPPVFP